MVKEDWPVAPTIMSSNIPISIEKVDHEDERVCRGLVQWLAPHEPHALFLLGNLAAKFPGSHLYVGYRDGVMVGIGGYYERPRSVCPFALDPGSAIAILRFIAARHPQIDAVNAIESIGLPCAQAMQQLGYQLEDDPRQVFMELPLPPGGLPHVTHEDNVRLMESSDAQRVAALMRHLQRPGDTSPITQAEIDRLLGNKNRVVLEVDGQIVATANTNGIGIRAFQLLGVVTDPEHRNRGYARAACAALIRRMHAQGAQHAVLFTNPDNLSAQRCYSRLGFRITGEYCMALFKARNG